MTESNFIISGSPSGSTAAIVPTPRCPVTVRPATPKDVPFIDALQKMHKHMVGFMPGKQIEGKIALGHVVIAEDERRAPVGYCISQDQYNGRDDVGIIYHLNVLPLRQRHLVGATLVKSVFERAAYGCKLFCLWCAQDIQANYFWESIGFLPLAFRTGSRDKQRLHIFWQRRIRDGDTTTPYWFPSKTKAGAIGEQRLVLPIPLGTHWRDPMPVLLPGGPQELPAQLPAPKPKRERRELKAPVIHSHSVPPGKIAVVTAGGMKYIDRGDWVEPPPLPKPKPERKPRPKHDPKHVAAARELRDRALEHFNSQPLLSQGKYDVARALPQSAVITPAQPKQLPDAA